MITVYATPVKKLTDIEINNIINSLSDSARARINKKRNEALRHASLCALSLISEKMRTDLDYTEKGRPFFKTLDADISISHSEKYAVVALATSKKEFVGIDVEDTNREKNSDSLLRFFTENERASFENGASEIEIWTKKEALFKHLNNDETNFVSLDTTTTDKIFTTKALDDALITVCTDKNIEIEFIHK